MSARDVVASEVIPREVIEDAVVKAFTNKGHEFYRAVEQSEDIVPVILTALTAAGYVVEQGWQDIATCPDGVGDALFAWWDAEFSSWIIERCAGWASSDRSEHQTAVEVAMEIGCTMWRPLPAPPAQEPQP